MGREFIGRKARAAFGGSTGGHRAGPAPLCMQVAQDPDSHQPAPASIGNVTLPRCHYAASGNHWLNARSRPGLPCEVSDRRGNPAFHFRPSCGEGMGKSIKTSLYIASYPQRWLLCCSPSIERLAMPRPVGLSTGRGGPGDRTDCHGIGGNADGSSAPGLKAAAEPTRLRILALCAHGELSVSDLTQILGQSQPRVSRHLKLLCDAGLLDRFREGTFAYFRLSDRGTCADLARTLADLIPAEDDLHRLDLERLEAIKRQRAEAAGDHIFAENCRALGTRSSPISTSRSGEVEVGAGSTCCRPGIRPPCWISAREPGRIADPYERPGAIAPWASISRA